ncbi:MAG TPA: transcriptional regulator [Streptosporangiaceae bacterium]|nr:transcriptional regulator [Streptosporangiaceae bacterium]
MDQQGSVLAALSSLGDPVRRNLYEFVAGHTEPVGRDEAAAAAGIGRPLAAYHLDKLVSLRLLTAAYQRPAGRGGPGAGRPAKVYARSGSEFAVAVPPREYELAARLLAVAVEADHSGASRAALHDAAQQFGADLGRRCRAADPGRTDARQAAEQALREHGFEPWHDGDGTVRLRNCPFHRLAAQHTETVCGMNLALIEGLVAGLGAGGLHPALDPQPGYCCVVIGTARNQATRGGRNSHDA